MSVPLYTKHIFKAKKSQFACIIPVLNEGARIISQLTKIKEKNIDQTCDIYICDGGSIDNISANSELMKSMGVTGLFIKTDTIQKGQGTQLKVGFHECIQMGYEGVVMVDGNDKDNIEVSLPLFFKKLEEGYDVVQSTRYRFGGKGVNTPLIREIAIRTIAVPMISLGAGYFYSDPCNGYKGFSKRYILDERMDWFGDFYHGYEYCYHPLVQAKRLGYKITEVPTVRTYPKGEIPSKIQSFGSHFKLLKLIFDISFSRIGPKDIKNNDLGQ